jgi:hypothetical protein
MKKSNVHSFSRRSHAALSVFAFQPGLEPARDLSRRATETSGSSADQAPRVSLHTSINRGHHQQLQQDALTLRDEREIPKTQELLDLADAFVHTIAPWIDARCGIVQRERHCPLPTRLSAFHILFSSRQPCISPIPNDLSDDGDALPVRQPHKFDRRQPPTDKTIDTRQTPASRQSNTPKP